MKHNLVSRNPICFRQWSRKRYAVFNSLGKQVKIGVLAFSMSLVALTQQVAAQADPTTASARESESEAVPIDEVTVNATPTLVSAEPARIVTVITRTEIAQLPVQNLSQLLEHIAGIDLRRRGTDDVQADINIRGGSFDQSLILLNGVNFTDSQTGHHNLNIPISLESIDRIEVLQGPGSRTLGPNAFAGIVNIVTGSASQSNAQAAIEGGSYGYLRLAADGALAQKKWTLFSAASHSQSDGYVKNTDYEISNFLAQARYADSTLGKWNLQLGVQRKNFGANNFYTLSYPNQYEATRTQLAALDYQKSVGTFTVFATAYYRRHLDRFELFRSNPPEWYSGHNYHCTNMLGGQLRAHLLSSFGKTTLGAELRSEHIFSNVLGEDMKEPKPVKGESESAFYTKEKQRTTLSWFAEQVYYHRAFSVSGGLQGSYSNDFGHYLCANADATYSLTNALQANASVGSSLRLPTFTDLYYRTATHASNPELKPEQAITYEAGVKYVQPVLSLHSSVFYRQGKNIIDWVRTDSTELWLSRNHIALNTLGVTLGGIFTPRSNLKRIVSSARLDYAYLQMDLDSREMQVVRMLDHLRHKLTLTCVHPLPVGFGFSWSVVHEQRNGQYVDYASQQSAAFAPVTLVNSRLWWQCRQVQLYVDMSNVFDERYFDFAGLQLPGRWIKAGVKVAVSSK